MGIDISALPSVPFGNPPILPPGLEGVYFVLDASDSVLYIGSSWMLRARWKNHNKRVQCAESGAARVAWYECRWQDAEHIEADLIFEMKPPLNVRGKKYAPALRISEIRAALKMNGKSAG